MTSFLRTAAALLLAASVAIGPPDTRAGSIVVKPVSCNCGGGGSPSYGPAGGHYAMSAPVAESYGPEAYGSEPPPQYEEAPSHGSFGPAPAYAGPVGGNPHAGGPPPGTVGMTYRRAARYIPEDKHPRTGMLTVEAAGASAMAVEGMKGYRDTDGYWQFETKEPLLPGIPHIYHVKARVGTGPDAPVEFRTVRLIPGRIIDLDW